MNKDIFWQIIDKARDAAGGEVNDDSKMSDYLIEALKDLDDEDLFRWQQIFYIYNNAAFKRKLWAAGHIIKEFSYDSGFQYFSCWLIAKGKDVYLTALREPDDLADIKINGRPAFANMLYAPNNAYRIKHYLNNDDNRYFDMLDKFPLMSDEEQSNIISEIIYAPDIDVDLHRGHDLKKLLPKLCEKFAWNGKQFYV